MNLAQLIDPEFAQRLTASTPARLKRSRAPTREAETKTPGALNPPEEPKKAASIAERIREALLGTTRTATVSLALLRERLPDLTALQLATNVSSLRSEGDVDRSGELGSYRYWLTEQGRARSEG
jgi:hypothetical protein